MAPSASATGATGNYIETMGLTLTEEISWHGHRCVFLRANTEHHTVALYPLALRAELGLRPDSLCMNGVSAVPSARSSPPATITRAGP